MCHLSRKPNQTAVRCLSTKFLCAILHWRRNMQPPEHIHRQSQKPRPWIRGVECAGQHQAVHCSPSDAECSTRGSNIQHLNFWRTALAPWLQARCLKENTRRTSQYSRARSRAAPLVSTGRPPLVRTTFSRFEHCERGQQCGSAAVCCAAVQHSAEWFEPVSTKRL